MKNKHNKLSRLIHRIKEELGATWRIARVTSFWKAITTFRAKIAIQIMNRKGYYESPRTTKLLKKKHNIMVEYYQKTFSDFLKTYQSTKNIPNNYISMDKTIWICWWQGLENAPEIVKCCVASIKRNAPDYNVIVLTEDNYKNYVTIPQWVEEKKNKGIITKTNYSDLLRLSLLAEHGGMWLDATFFATSKIPNEYFEMPIWSIKRPDYGHASVAQGYFAGYSLACRADYRWVFITIRDFFLNYWKNNDTMVDYLMVDYMIVLAQLFNNEIADAFNQIPANNPKCDDLFIMLNQPYSEDKWNDLIENTRLFKLSWKYDFKTEVDNKKTFYSYILDKNDF